jgi:hypothetical protein
MVSSPALCRFIPALSARPPTTTGPPGKCGLELRNELSLNKLPDAFQMAAIEERIAEAETLTESPPNIDRI